MYNKTRLGNKQPTGFFFLFAGGFFVRGEKDL